MRLDDVYDHEAEQELLAAILEPRYLGMLAAAQEAVGSAMQAFPGFSWEDFRLDDEATRAILAEAAERVVLIDAATRDAIRAELQEGQKRGYSAHQLAHGVPEEQFGGIDGLFRTTWQGRAETVSRTELSWASATSALDRYKATGLVDRVRIHENTDTDRPCAERAGKVVPLSDHPMPLHPNCRMGLEPVLADEP